MEKPLAVITEALPMVFKNSQISLSLEGWPAAVSVIALCCAGVAICAINATHTETIAYEVDAA